MKNRCSFVRSLDTTLEQLELSYFLFNKVENKLENINSGISIGLLENDNPIIYSFITKDSYLVKNVMLYSELSLFSTSHSKKCFLVPIEQFGVMCFYGLDTLDDNNIQVLLCDIGALYLSLERKYTQIKQLKNEIDKTYNELRVLQKRDNNILKESYLNHMWIDFSGVGKSFKRNILFYTNTNRILNIVGEKGSGKSHLATIIQQLRNAYGEVQNIVDLKNISDSVQLRSIFGINHKGVNCFDYRYDNTLILKNINSLSVVLLEELYELLSNNETIKKNNVKIILTSTDRSLCEGACKDMVDFFNQEVLLLHNRLDNKNNFIAFVDVFINSYYRKNLKNIRGITEGALELLRSSKFINSLDDLKQHVFAICDIVKHGGQLDKHKAKMVLDHTNLTQNKGLSEQVEQYERSLILKVLALNNWNQEETARQFNIPRRTLSYKCAKHNIKGKYAK